MDSDSDNDAVSISSAEDGSVAELKAADIKLQQLRRGARKKRGDGNKLQGLQSFEAVAKAHALKRMQDGLRTVLCLHNPVELSSICGCLKLKVQQKANTSIESIIRYASAMEEMHEQRIRHILNFLWEGALWEYLHSIGHPIHTMALDPRDTIYEIWKEGGFMEGHGTFIPHFIVREVKKRNEWIQSEDILSRLKHLEAAQEKSKVAERRIIAEHDYSNILSYFNHMANLRSMENSVREYLISELEIARSRIDSQKDVAKMLREQLSETEQQFVRVTEALNMQLAYAEILQERAVRGRLLLEENLQRTNNILDSYLECEENRQEVHGGTLQPLKLRRTEIDSLPPTVKTLLEKLQLYRDKRDTHDNNLRARARCHVTEIDNLKEKVAGLEEELRAMTDRFHNEKKLFDHTLIDYAVSDRRVARLESMHKFQVEAAWKRTTKLAAENFAYKTKLKQVKPVLLAGLMHSNPLVLDICWTMLDKLELAANRQEKASWMESIIMKKEDDRSRQQRKADNLKLLPPTTPKVVSIKGGAKSGSKSPTKRGIAASSSGKKKSPSNKKGRSGSLDDGKSIATASSASSGEMKTVKSANQMQSAKSKAKKK